MEMRTHTLCAVVDRSQISAARHEATRAAAGVGFDETDAHRVGLVATELASNLVKHTSGQGGALLLKSSTGAIPEVELIAIDRGPGMRDVLESLTDGHSTAGSQGTGLGAVTRLADEFDVFSQPNAGTAVLARMRRAREAGAAPGRFQVGGVSIAKTGEIVCGDAWATTLERRMLTVVVVDGLGHGPLAETAARAATAAAVARTYSSPLATLTAMHGGAAHTRGAAALVASVDLPSATVTVAGIGNVAAAIVGVDAVRRAASQAGILGHDVRRLREYQYPWPEGAVLIVHSDGLVSHWSLDGYPGLRRRDLALVAAVLYRDFQRGRDDVTVVAARQVA
jgi:anti-sigma regulatory factor (Ser/Thr protein kinase)